MQRQSLGSPASKLHANGVVLIKEDAHISSSSTAELSQKPFSSDDDDGEEKKLQKKLHKTTPSPEKFIHIIPVLTLFCILILYLSSHDPSQTGNIMPTESSLLNVIFYCFITANGASTHPFWAFADFPFRISCLQAFIQADRFNEY